MIRLVPVLVLAVAATAGCETLPLLKTEESVPPSVVQELPPPPPPTVTPDQVTETNAAEIVEALREELDYTTNPR